MPSLIFCPVCGSNMYPTDKTNLEVSFRCASPDARFWDFDRGTFDQQKAKDHWDRSIQEVILKKG